MSAAVRPASSRARRMHAIAPTPPGDGAVMWWASALLPAPTISPRMFAPRATADSHSSEHERSGALTEDEPVAIDVERLAAATGGQRRHVAERGQPDRARRALRTTGDDGVGHVPGDQSRRVADGMGGRRACGGDGLVGATQPVLHRDRRTGCVGHHHRHEERRDPPLALAEQHFDLLLGGAQTTDAGGEDGPDAVVGQVRATAVLEHLRRGSDGELLHLVGPPRLLRAVVPGGRIPVVDDDAALGR